MLNWTNNGEDGWEPRLGEEAGPLMDGEDGLCPGLFVDSVRFSRGAAMCGLDSRDGDGDVMLGDTTADVALLEECIPSARIFWMMSLLALSRTGKFL